MRKEELAVQNPSIGKDGLLASNRQVLREGVRDGMPIALGYFVVSFTLGIAARNAGLKELQRYLLRVTT